MLTQDFKEFIELLNKNNVRYLVVGGYALAFHGHPRFTKDIDIWIWIDQENAELLLKTIHEFGFKSINLSKNDFLIPGNIVQLGIPPNRIDILTSVSGLDFESSYSKKSQINIDGLVISFLDEESFKINKKSTGRLQDLADVETLES